MNKFTRKVKDKKRTILKGAYSLEIYRKLNKGYIEVWLTNEEQQMYDRSELAERLLSIFGYKKTPCANAECLTFDY